MKIAILSDIHGSLPGLDSALAKLAPWQPALYLLLGDLLNHGPRNPIPQGYDPIAVATRLNELADKIIAVRGNCDSEVDQMLLQFPIMAPHNQLYIAGRRWFISHGHLYQAHELVLPAGSVVISGHSHLAGLSQDEQRVWVNPGSLSFARGQWPVSYGCYESGEFRIHACEDGQLLQRLTL